LKYTQLFYDQAQYVISCQIYKRVVEVELLDPMQCMTITEDVDSVIWCATDFDGNRPKSVASLNAAFLFRAIASPTKARVEIEVCV